ncbi:regucalcin-like [Penaeus japonicus]|uniref:regucalcin-like n=1 Tax=Penaeus japonicus TaxID=27405 RepID=UPI001C70C789|nr:regucalcin-like [Penaeus japonicus]
MAVAGKDLSLFRWSVYDPDDHNTTAKAIHTTRDFGFNDAKCDPQGRLWAGTVAPLEKDAVATEADAAGLYRLDSNLVVTKWASVFLSNGLAWSPDRRSFYYVDTHTRTIDEFDYHDESGAISNRRPLLNYTEAGLEDQVPDGMAIDVAGNLWVASFGRHQVLCLDPRTRRIVRRITIPAKNPTSVCWGGPDYSILFVTSGTLFMSQEEIDANPSSGRTFAVTGLGTKGLPAARFRVNFDKLRAQGVFV